MILLKYILLSLALSIDSFAAFLCFSPTKEKKSKKYYILIPLSVGILHIIFPIISFNLMLLLNLDIGYAGKIISATIFFILALTTLFLKKDFLQKKSVELLSIILLVLAVSIDSFVIGISLSFTTQNIILPAIIFGTVSLIVTLFSLLIGHLVVSKIKINLDYLAAFVFITLGILTLLDAF